MHEIRLAGREDADALVDLHHACWREAYAGLLPESVIEGTFAGRATMVAQRRERLVDPDRPTYVAERDGELTGFACAGPARHDDAPVGLELYAIYARAASWGHGVGHDLLGASVGERAAYLWVLDGNARAIGFYERHGFALDGGEDEEAEALHLRMVRATPWSAS